MGNSYSIDTESGSIAIRVEQLKYYSGQQINGWIYLNLYKPFNSNDITILVTGKEKVKLVTVTTSNDQHGHQSRHVSVHKEKYESFGYHYQILPYIPGQFPGGQYAYPFSFILPNDLNPSFEYNWSQEGHNCYAKIEYKLKAIMRDEQKKRLLKEKMRFVIDRPLSYNVNYPQNTRYQAKVQGYCSTDLGEIDIASACDKSEYLSGDVANVHMDVDARAMKADINKVIYSLNQNLMFKAQGHTENKITPLAKGETKGIRIGEIYAGQTGFNFVLPINLQGSQQTNVDGKLVKCHYYLEQLCEVARCQCYNEDAKTSMAINIVNMTMQPFVMPPQMMNAWSPQVMPPAVFALSNNNAIDGDFRRQYEQMKGN